MSQLPVLGSSSTSSSATSASFSSFAELRNCSSGFLCCASVPRLADLPPWKDKFARVGFLPGFAIVQTDPRGGLSKHFGHFFVSASSSVVDVASLSFSLPFPALSSSAGVLRFHISGFPRRNVGVNGSFCFSPRLFLVVTVSVSRDACIPPPETSHTVSHFHLEPWSLFPGDLFETSFRHDVFSLAPQSPVGRSSSCRGCLGDREYDWAGRRHWFHWESNVL